MLTLGESVCGTGCSYSIICYHCVACRGECNRCSAYFLATVGAVHYLIIASDTVARSGNVVFYYCGSGSVIVTAKQSDSCRCSAYSNSRNATDDNAFCLIGYDKLRALFSNAGDRRSCFLEK